MIRRLEVNVIPDCTVLRSAKKMSMVLLPTWKGTVLEMLATWLSALTPPLSMTSLPLTKTQASSSALREAVTEPMSPAPRMKVPCQRTARKNLELFASPSGKKLLVKLNGTASSWVFSATTCLLPVRPVVYQRSSLVVASKSAMAPEPVARVLPRAVTTGRPLGPRLLATRPVTMPPSIPDCTSMWRVKPGAVLGSLKYEHRRPVVARAGEALAAAMSEAITKAVLVAVFIISTRSFV
jgi:hypothetical protein